MHLEFLKVMVALNFEWIFPKIIKGMDYLILGIILIVKSVIDVGSTKMCCLAITCKQARTLYQIVRLA